MHPLHLMAARSHVFGLGSPEAIVGLILLLVLFSGYTVPQPLRLRSQPGRLTRTEIYFVSTLGIVFAVALAVIVWQSVGR